MCKHILIRQFDKDSDFNTIADFIEMSYERDGYGAIIRLYNNELLTFKGLDKGSFYIEMGAVLQTGRVKEIVLHHRQSTNKPGLDYAHPFEFKGNYLTHNGVVAVPGKHDTKTENDSEALLHYLIKNDYKTMGIEGYFSCFVMNSTGTTVLVDATAPIYTDGRVFCSHKLIGLDTKLEMLKVDFDLAGVRSERAIEVTKSNYGVGLKSLSLDNHWDYPDYVPGLHDDTQWYEKLDAVESFMDSLSDDEIEGITRCTDEQTANAEIVALADIRNISLTNADISELICYYTQVGYY